LSTQQDYAIQRKRRGGNRLAPDHYRSCGPRYERSRGFSSDPERRDRGQRTRTRRAVALAITRGELSPVLATVLYQLIDRCPDTLVRPVPITEGGAEGLRRPNWPLVSGWWSLGYIRNLVPDELVAEPEAASVAGAGAGGHDQARSRTAGRWMAVLRECGWIERIHRQRIVNGEPTGTSNLWRIRIPDHLRAVVYEMEAEDWARRSGRRSGGARPRRAAYPVREGHSEIEKTQQAAQDTYRRNDARKSTPCPRCNGDGLIESVRDPGRVEVCGACRGQGTAAADP
jgi:hypothetical protein